MRQMRSLPLFTIIAAPLHALSLPAAADPGLERQETGTTETLYAARGTQKALYAVGDKGVILSSNDDGRSWSLRAVEVTEALLDIASVGEHNLYIAGKKGTLLRSQD